MPYRDIKQNLCRDPITIAVIGAVGAVAGSAVSASISSKASKKVATKNREVAQTLADKDRRFAEEETKQNNIVLAENRQLAEKQLVLEAGRNKIETLAFLKSSKQSSGQSFTISSAPQPVQSRGFLDSINSFIQGFF